MTPNGDKLAQAASHCEAGRLDEAERLCREVLNAEPALVDAWRQLSAVQSQRGDLLGACQSLERAARLLPADETIARQLRLTEAVCAYQQAVVLSQAQQTSAASERLRQAVSLVPSFADAHFLLGTLLAMAGKYDESTECFRRTIACDPGKVDAHYNLGLALQHQQKLAEAEPHFRRASELDPRSTRNWNQLGIVLDQLKQKAEAEDAFRQALAIDPGFADAEYHLSGLLLDAGRYVEAETHARRVVTQRPVFPGGHYNLASALAEQRQLPEAEVTYRRVTEIDPQHADGRMGLAGVLLAQGRFEEGWPAYEWRYQHPDALPIPLERGRWRGEPLEGRSVLLHVEQGFGDAIQFVRYAELVKERGGHVVLGSSAAVERLLATCPWVDEIASKYELLPPFDVQVPLLSLPGVFHTTLETIPAHVPYLFPDAAETDRWREELGPREGEVLRIGIAWQGNRSHRRDQQRSIPLEHFARIARLPGVRLYSLQTSAGREQIGSQTADWPLVDLGERLGDFHRTAALLKNLDLVITCDSAPAHLAGAIGVPVWVALAFWPDWRWLLGRDDSPWYPTARLFRQPRPGDWNGALAEIEAALEKLLVERIG